MASSPESFPLECQVSDELAARLQKSSDKTPLGRATLTK